MSEQKEPRLFPIQRGWRHHPSDGALVPEPVYMAAYEVHSAIYGPQEAMIDLEKGCRGGFCAGELAAFLYARAFPRQEWRARVDEAFRGMRL